MHGFWLQQLKFRLGESNFFAGGRYLLLKTYNTFEIPLDIPEFNGYEQSSTLSEATLKLELDSRNNVFTPTNGVFLWTMQGHTVTHGWEVKIYMAGSD